MKKTVLTLSFCFLFFGTVFAQYVQWGIIGGVEFSNYSIHDGFMNDVGFSDLHSKPGIKLAVEAEYPLTKNLFLVPEAAFIQRGSKMTAGSDAQKTRNERINYLHLPVNLMYKFESDTDLKFCIYGGPYVSHAISGNRKNESDIAETEIKFGNDKYDAEYAYEYKPIDLGLNFGIGLEYVNCFFRLQYSLGFTNLLNGQDFKYLKNRNVGFSVGYLF